MYLKLKLNTFRSLSGVERSSDDQDQVLGAPKTQELRNMRKEDTSNM